MRISNFRVGGAAVGVLALTLAGCGGNGTMPGSGSGVPCYNDKCVPTPGGGSTTAPGGGSTTAPGGGSTTAPGGGSTTAPGGGSTTAPGGGSTTAPGGGSTTAPGGGATSTPSGGATPGSVVLGSSLLVPVGVTNPATAQTTISQSGYSGAYTASISCPVSLPTGALTASVSGNTVTVTENPALVPLVGANVFCTLTITGGGGVSTTAMILLASTVAPMATPTPAGTPNPGATPGSVSVAPGLLVPVGLGGSGTATATVSEDGYAGPYAAAVTCPLDIPLGTLTASVSGSTVTVTENGTFLKGITGANLLCTLTVTGGNGNAGTANVLVALNIGG